MEIEGEDGSKTQLKKGCKINFGRGLGFDSEDRTVSRHHVSFEPNSAGKVHFEVIGKNPIWVCSRGSDEIRVFRRRDGDEMEDGDMFCVSARKPIWFTAKRLEFESEDEGGVMREIENESELAEGLKSRCYLRRGVNFELESVDVSGIDPVKEFGFLVLGQEFNHYPKEMIRHVKTWNWFLEEPNKDNEDDEVSNKKGKKGIRRKRKKDEGDDDDEWTGESEDDKEVVTKSRKAQRQKYSTRSKDQDKPIKGTGISKRSVDTNEEDEEDEDDDTLGGFIVKNDDMEEEEEEEEEGGEEEDYDEEDDDE